MVRLAVHVEGQTEERLIKDLIGPHLAARGVFATPILIATGRTADGTRARGGGVSLDRVTDQLARLIGSYRNGFVTTLYDLYGFRGRLPGEDAAALEERIADRLRRPANLMPYVQRHEFEALLLSAPEAVAHHFGDPAIADAIGADLEKAGGPEELNDGATTAPSKRLARWTEDRPSRYSAETKMRHAPPIFMATGLPRMRSACPRFDSWLSRLERLAPR